MKPQSKSEPGRACKVTQTLAIAAAVVVVPQALVSAQQCETTRLSLTSQGTQMTTYPKSPTLSRNARYVALDSDQRLVPGDNNGMKDSYLLDLVRMEWTLLARLPTGEPTAWGSCRTKLSRTGRYSAFQGRDELIPGDSNGLVDVIFRDNSTGEFELISWTISGELRSGQPGSSAGCVGVSDDGRFVLFSSDDPTIIGPGDANGTGSDLFLRDRLLNSTEVVNVDLTGVNTHLGFVAGMSSTGRYVPFSSASPNIVPVDVHSGWDAFLRDMTLGTTSLVSVSSQGVQANANSWVSGISSDGRYVCFTSSADNLVPSDTNGFGDVFLRDLVAGTTHRVSELSDGTITNGHSYRGQPSDCGRYVIFESEANNLVPGDTNGREDVFRRDMITGSITLMSSANDGTVGVLESRLAYDGISGDGTRAVFLSRSNNLVPGDTGWIDDLFLRDCGFPLPEIYCTAKVNSLGCTGTIGEAGMASATSSLGFRISADNIRNRAPGVLFYGLSGRDARPFLGGWLCVQGPVQRTPPQDSGGNPFPYQDCSGTFGYDFNARIQSGVDPALVAGQSVWCQYYSRDSGFPGIQGIHLTDAMEFEIQP